MVMAGDGDNDADDDATMMIMIMSLTMVTVVLRSETIVIIILRAADAVATAITDAAVTYTGKVTDTARKAAGAVAPRVLCGILSISVLTIIVILVLIDGVLPV